MKKLLFLVVFIILKIDTALPQWRLCKGPFGGKIRVVFADTSTGTIFAGSTGNISYSLNSGNNWHECTGMEGYYEVNKIIKVNQTYFSAGTLGVYKSEDGIAWTSCNNNIPDTYVMNLTAINDTLFISTWSGLFFSSDNGENWNIISGGLPENTYVTSLVKLDSVYMASTESKKVYQSTDYGQTWNEYFSNIETYSTVEFIVEDTVILASTINGFFKSFDHGQNFFYFDGPEWVKNWTKSNGILYALTENDIYFTSDHGDSWSIVDISNLRLFNSLSVLGSRLFLGSFEGMYISEDFGQNWAAKNEGLQKTKVLVLSMTGESIIVSSTYEGSFISKDGGMSWTNANNGLSQEHIMYNTVYSMINANQEVFAGANGLYVSNDSGQHWVQKTTLNLPVYDLLKSGDSLFIATQMGVNRLLDDQDEPEEISNGLPLDYGYLPFVNSIVKQGNTLYAGLFVNGVYKSDMNDISWQPAKNGLPEHEILNTMYVCDSLIYVGYSYSGIFVSPDQGSTWKNINNELGDTINVSEIISSDGKLFIATSYGIYLSIDNGSTWTAVNDGLPERTTVLDIVYNDDRMYISCPTRGVWYRNMSDFNSQTRVSEIKSTEISVYPTIVKNVININISGKSMPSITELYDIHGIKIMTCNNVNSINMDQMNNGIYIVKVRAAGITLVQKIVKL